MPYINRLARELNVYKSGSYVPPGHFYSPVIALTEVLKRAASIFHQPAKLHDVDLNESGQLKVLDELAKFYGEISWPDDSTGSGYYYRNRYFTWFDAIILHGVMRHWNPKRIIEVGSGFSSAAMMEVNEKFASNKIELTFIEPYPGDRFDQFAKSGKPHQLMKAFLQDVDLNLFRNLQENDILFIDSSHVSKTGSDVNHILFEILPILKPGVIIHFHDIFYPFEYPRTWAEQKRSWNEAYILRAFLMNNRSYEILMFNSWVDAFHKDELRKKMPLCLNDAGSSIWLMKR